MSQSNENEVKLHMQSVLNHGPLAETSDFRSFHLSDMHRFSTISTVKDSFQQPSAPSYRVIRKNVKSINQYKKERNRRRQVWKLHCDGRTHPQIAEKLRISEKTVQRDIKKIWPYHLGQIRKQLRELEEKRRRQLMKELDGMTLTQRFQALTDTLIKQRKQQRGREYRRHLLKVFINVDEGKNGIPRISHWPSPNHMSMVMPIHVKLYVIIKGMKLRMGGFDIL